MSTPPQRPHLTARPSARIIFQIKNNLCDISKNTMETKMKTDGSGSNSAHLSPTGCPISHRAAAFDPFDAAYQQDPAEALRWAREEEPVFYNPTLGYWIVTRYDDVKAVFRDPVLFSPANALEKLTPPSEEAQNVLRKYNYALDRTMVNEDEPQHMQRRRLLLDDFLPDNLARHEPAVRRLTRAYMDRFIDKGQADLVADIFYEIPLTIALHFLGVPDDDAAQLREFAVAHTLNTWGRPTPEQQVEIAENVGRFWQTANRILDRMIADPTGEGWMYESVRQHFKHPEIVTESYLRSMMMAILAAAHETTSNATANAFWTLLNDREAWEQLCENPKLIPSAVEECLRVAGSIIAWRRVATRETSVGGVTIPEGGKLLLVQASANKDPRHWDNPEQVDIYRDNAVEHLTFGYGAHQCMGKNIGRMEMRIFLEEFTRRLPHMRLKPGQNFDNLPNISFRGPSALLVEWDPARNPERKDPALLEKALHFPIGAPIKDDILREVIVSEVVEETPRIRRYVLSDPKGRALPNWAPGSHIDIKLGDLRRKYSLCGSPDSRTCYEIAILRDDAGRGGSKRFHQELEVGSTVQIAGPRTHFGFDLLSDRYVLIAGGVGITPIVAMADALRAAGLPYEVIYCGRDRGDMAFLDRIEGKHGNACTVHVSSEDGRLNLSERFRYVPSGTRVYACGPEQMLEELQSLARAWPEDTLRIEHFSATSSAASSQEDTAFEVVLQDSGLTLRVARDQSLLDALTARGVDVQADCREGLCGSCQVSVVSGDLEHRDRVLTLEERRSGDKMMSCCSRGKGQVVLAL
jgi:cytochrome P450/ferredoxin-NADP reductase